MIFLIRWLITVLVVLASAYLLPGIMITDFITAIVAVAVLALVNAYPPASAVDHIADKHSDAGTFHFCNKCVSYYCDYLDSGRIRYRKLLVGTGTCFDLVGFQSHPEPSKKESK